MRPPDFREPDLGTFPLVFGGDDVVEGYYALERAERNQGMGTLASRHQREVWIWYRLLTLHRRAFLRGFAFGCPEDELTAHGLRALLLALGLSCSKAALDMLLAGYYSVAYAAIRHMVESMVLCHYLELMPKAAAAFYAASPGAPDPPKVPPFKNIVGELKKTYPDIEHLFVGAYSAWLAMGKGAHPTGIGIVQVLGDEGGRGVLGPTYHPNMATDGFAHGLTAALGLVFETGRLQPQPPEWEAAVVRVAQELAVVRGEVGDRS